MTSISSSEARYVKLRTVLATSALLRGYRGICDRVEVYIDRGPFRATSALLRGRWRCNRCLMRTNRARCRKSFAEHVDIERALRVR